MSEARSVCYLPAEIAERMRSHARAAAPEEACGFLLGDRRTAGIRIDGYAESANLAPDRRRQFETDPALRLRLQRDLRPSGRAVVGVFHSHPEGPAEPSRTDAARAVEPGFLWILADSTGRLSAYCAPDTPAGVFAPIDLEIGEIASPVSPED